MFCIYSLSHCFVAIVFLNESSDLWNNPLMITITKSRSMSASCTASATSNHLYSKPLGRPGVCVCVFTHSYTHYLVLVITFNNFGTISFRFPSRPHITSGIPLLIPSHPGNPRLQSYDKDVFSAASWAGWAADRANTCLCGPQEPSQSLNSQPERPKLHHHSLAASTSLQQVIFMNQASSHSLLKMKQQSCFCLYLCVCVCSFISWIIR